MLGLQGLGLIRTFRWQLRDLSEALCKTKAHSWKDKVPYNKHNNTHVLCAMLPDPLIGEEDSW